MWYSRFSHDVTKIQTKKLSVLLSFFFHEALQHLNTLIYWNFWFERVPPFAIEGDWIFRLLRDAAFSGRPGKLICGLKTLLIFNFEILLSKHSLSQNKYNFNIYEFLKQWIHSCVGKLKDRCFCRFPAAMVPYKGTPTWCLHTKPYKFGYNAFRISRIMKHRTDLSLGEAFCIFIFFHFPDSGLSVLNGMHFYFWWCDGENREMSLAFPKNSRTWKFNTDF